jgi:hypothetical protein
MGHMNVTGVDFINGIGRKMSQLTNDVKEISFLWQIISVALQRLTLFAFATLNLDDPEPTPPHES